MFSFGLSQDEDVVGVEEDMGRTSRTEDILGLRRAEVLARRILLELRGTYRRLDLLNEQEIIAGVRNVTAETDMLA